MVESRHTWRIFSIVGMVFLISAVNLSPISGATHNKQFELVASPKVLIFNTGKTQLDGVSLIKGTPEKHVGLPQRQVLSALESRIGKAKIFSSSICSGMLPVTVAQWNDLSVVFETGKFALLFYNYKGWPFSQRAHPSPPPIGVSLKPLIKTEFGATVGDSAAKVKALDPKLRGEANNSFLAGGFSLLVMSKRSGVAGSSKAYYVVSQIQAATGNC